MSKPVFLDFKGKSPKIDKTAFIGDNVVIAGDVEIGEDSSVWFNSVIRGDVNDVKIGKRVNIQDGTIIHVSTKLQGTYIGDDVTIGHMVLLHACTIENLAFIGMQACLMDEVYVETGAMIAAGSLVTPRKRIPSGQLWGGRPARYMRDLTVEEKEYLKHSADHYVSLSKEYL